jgi:hypothetical protein
MGLDITAYAKITLVEAITHEELQAKEWDHAYLDDGVHVLLETDAWKRFDGPSGFYAHGETEGFRAGSYSGYNRWREQLATLVGTTPEKVWDGASASAFGELINFSDAEGVIGGNVCAKLAKDFADWQERAAQYATANKLDDWFMQKYADWQIAFDLAANDGAVDFH